MCRVLACSVWLTGVVVLQIFEGVVNLLDRLQAWHCAPGSPGSLELREMAYIGLRIITGYIQQQDSQVSLLHRHTHTHTNTLTHTLHPPQIRKGSHHFPFIVQGFKQLKVRVINNNNNSTNHLCLIEMCSIWISSANGPIVV